MPCSTTPADLSRTRQLRTDTRTSILPALLTTLMVTCGAPNNVHAASNASLSGQVIEAGSGLPIADAQVTLSGHTVKTDSNGKFVIDNLPVGRTVLSIDGRSRGHDERSIDVTAGNNTVATIALSSGAVQLSDVNVVTTDSVTLSKFDDKASTDTLTESVSDATLKNGNAQNVSDFMKDVAGVAVSKGANGTSSVSVRGIDQRMLRITVDGQRQGGSGNPLDNIPPEIVQSLEVTKTFTPDMEADAVGGVINVNTGGILIKDAYVQGRHQANYNTTAPHPGARNSLTLGQPFSLFADKHNASLLTTVSFDDQFSRRERVSTLRQWTSQMSPGPDPYTGLDIPVLTLPLIEATREHRQRTGLVFNSDARFDDLAVYLRSNLSRDWAHRIRNFNDTDPSSGVVRSLTPTSGTFEGVNLSRRNQDQTSKRDALNTSFGAKSKIDNLDWDASLAYGQTHEQEPHTLDAAFVSADTYTASYDLGPNAYQPAFSFEDESNAGNSSNSTDPSHYRFDYLYLTHSELHEQDGSGKFNLKITLENGVNYLKFGGKAQQRHRSADTDRDIYDGVSSNQLDMNGLVGSSLIDMNTLNYQFGPVPNAAAVAGLLSSNPTAFKANSDQAIINSTSGDTRVTETLWALYGMGKYMFGQWTVLGGVRIEGTHVTSSGNQMQLDNTGKFVGFTGISAVNNYVEVLPGLHLRYEPRPGLLYRGSVTRSMSRPNSADIAPFRTLSFIDQRSRIGAPDLKPYLSTNFDWSVDKYSETYGLTSFALFYKKIDHFITDAQYPVNIGNLGEFIEFKRVNGDTAFATGAELSWQSPTWSLPLHMGKGSVEANYNFNHGEAHHPGRSGEVFPLPRQVDHQASIKLHETRGPLSLDTSISYRSGWWEDLIARGFDNYITSAWDAEISGSYKIGKTTRITAGANNLLNRPTKHYAGIPSRMNDWQRNGVEMNLGVQWKM